MEDDEDYCMLSARLYQYATLEINAQALKTGFSRDLSGEVSNLDFHYFVETIFAVRKNRG